MHPSHPTAGLGGEPFTDQYSEELYWEGRRVRARLEDALEVLGRGEGLWVSGSPGSGRQAFVAHLSARLSAKKLPAVVIDAPYIESGERFIELLHRWLSDKPLPPTHIERCESLYIELLDGLWRGGTVICLTGVGALGGTALEEARILTGLKVFGEPLARLVLCGEEAPALDVSTIKLEPYGEEELARIIAHRLVLAGAKGALTDETVSQLAGEARGPQHLLELARIALGRARFKGAGAEQPGPRGDDSQGEAPTPGNNGGKSSKPIFSPEEVADVARLLKDI